MQDDLKKGLLSKKGGSFQKLYEDCLIRIQRIKQNNDVIQRRLGNQDEEQIKQQILKQKQYIETQITELKKIMQQIQAKYRDPESKNKLKQIKNDAEKQIQRNKVILKDFISKSFGNQANGKKLNGHNYNGKHNQDQKSNKKHVQTKNGNKGDKSQPSLLTEEQQLNDQIVIDYEMQRKILLEKTQMMNEVQQSTNKLNEIVNDMAVLVDQQGQNLDIITQQMIKVKQNVGQANENLQQANYYQKKSRKKYVCLVILILLIIIGAAGALYIILG